MSATFAAPGAGPAYVNRALPSRSVRGTERLPLFRRMRFPMVAEPTAKRVLRAGVDDPGPLPVLILGGRSESGDKAVDLREATASIANESRRLVMKRCLLTKEHQPTTFDIRVSLIERDHLAEQAEPIVTDHGGDRNEARDRIRRRKAFTDLEADCGHLAPLEGLRSVSRAGLRRLTLDADPAAFQPRQGVQDLPRQAIRRPPDLDPHQLAALVVVAK